MTTMNRATVRDEKIIVKMSADRKAELQQISEEMGVSMSAIGAYIIGQWLMQQRAMKQVVMPKMLDVMEGLMVTVAQGQQDALTE